MLANADYTPSPAQTDALVAFLTTFERPDFVPSTVESPPGVRPYHIFAEELSQFHRAVFENGFVIEFDWRAWQEEALRHCEQPELLRNADLQVLRKLITFHVRAERFNEGHLPSLIESGYMAALLRRLKELRQTFDPAEQ
jgi:O-acetyl-ADP-ribose deacetylase